MRRPCVPTLGFIELACASPICALLPKINMQNKYNGTSLLCPLCSSHPETIWHYTSYHSELIIHGISTYIAATSTPGTALQLCVQQLDMLATQCSAEQTSLKWHQSLRRWISTKWAFLY
jgi:hypothetical protein